MKFVQEQKEGKNKTANATTPQLIQTEVCNFIKSFADSSNDNMTQVCDAKAMNIVEKQDKLQLYLHNIDKEYKDCENDLKCLAQMTPDVKENAVNIRSFLKKMKENPATIEDLKKQQTAQ